jgi:hypothetical protein
MSGDRLGTTNGLLFSTEATHVKPLLVLFGLPGASPYQIWGLSPRLSC